MRFDAGVECDSCRRHLRRRFTERDGAANGAAIARLVVADMAHYARFIGDTLLRHPSVQDCKSSFVLERVKGTTAMPV